MQKIKILKDLTNLKERQALPSPLLNHLEKYFYQLFEALSDNESPEEFSLEHHGYFVVLDVNDNLRDLCTVGLNHENEGLLGSRSEYVEILKLDDGNEWYKVAILYDNAYMMFFYLQPKDFDDEVQQWLENLVDEERLFLNSAAEAPLE